MQIKNTKKINDYIMDLNTTSSINEIFSNSFMMVLTSKFECERPDELEAYAKKMQEKWAKENSINFSYDESIMALILLDMVDEAGLDGMIKDNMFEILVRKSKIFRDGEFADNSYLTNIKFENKKIGKYELFNNSFAKYEPFMYDEPVEDLERIYFPKIGAFDHDFAYPSIKENGYISYSVNPILINTMEQPIKEAKGNVLVLGCGMGYFAYMASLKEEVSKITIIEKKSEIVELFTKYILPQFSMKDKVEIIQADPFEYIKKLEDGAFDYCLAEVWENYVDTTPYLRMKKIGNRFKKMEMVYWQEEALAQMLIGYEYVVIVDSFLRNMGMGVNDHYDLPLDEQYKINIIRDLLKKVKIEKVNQFDYYLNYKNFIKMLGKLV